MRIYSKLMFFVLVGTVSCSNNEEKMQILKEANKLNSAISIDEDWSLDQMLESEELGNAYRLSKVSSLRKEKLSIAHAKNEKRYYIDDYRMEKIEGGYKYVLRMLHDTLYYYKRLDSINSELEFIVGKYNYLASHSGLNSAQDDYFHKNYDSLTKVKGNNLPDLPESENPFDAEKYLKRKKDSLKNISPSTK